MLLAIPQIEDVRQIAATSSGLDELEVPGPDLVLIDAEALGKTTWVLLEQIRAKAPHCRCIALVYSSRQQREALEAGADAVLVKGFSAAQLSVAARRLLSRQEPEEA
jgi:DNA-binding response OmpR family regulator